MGQKKFKKGDRVYWKDPEDELASGRGVVTEALDGADIIELEMESGSFIQALEHELVSIDDIIDADDYFNIYAHWGNTPPFLSEIGSMRSATETGASTTESGWRHKTIMDRRFLSNVCDSD